MELLRHCKAVNGYYYFPNNRLLRSISTSTRRLARRQDPSKTKESDKESDDSSNWRTAWAGQCLTPDDVPKELWGHQTFEFPPPRVQEGRQIGDIIDGEVYWNMEPKPLCTERKRRGVSLSAMSQFVSRKELTKASPSIWDSERRNRLSISPEVGDIRATK